VKSVHVLGGGPAGLAAVHGMALDRKIRFQLYERGPSLGGLAQTVVWQGVGAHDLGPHKIFTLDKGLERRVESLLTPDDWLTRDKVSKIYMNGKFLPYPPSPLSLSGVFGIGKFAGMVWDYGWAQLASFVPGRAPPKTFEQDLRRRVGRSLLDMLFAPIARKLWGEPSDLDVKLSQGRVQTPSPFELIGRVLGIKGTSEFEALTFRYPKGGLQRLWQAIEQQSSSGGSFHRNSDVQRIEVADGRVTAIRVVDKATGQETRHEVGPDDFVASTLPLGLLPRLMPDVVGPEEAKLINDVLRLNDLLLVFLHYPKPSLFDDSWVFVPDPDIAFHRISEQESFDPGMTPNGTIVCCELMSGPHRPLAEKSDDELIEMAKAGVAKMGYASEQPAHARVIRLPRSYPVFRPGYQEALDKVLSRLDTVKNFRTIGRQGAFNYIGTLDAMDIGYGFARWLGAGEEAWTKERARTSHYDVLD